MGQTERVPVLAIHLATVQGNPVKLLALTKYGRQAASTRQRLMQYEPYLAGNGVEVEYAPLFNDAYVQRLAKGHRGNAMHIAFAYARRLRMLLAHHDADLIWLHYEAFPFLPAPFERLIAKMGRPVILDYDDAIFHMYNDHVRASVRRLLGRKLETTIAMAAAVTVGNDYLRDYATPLNSNVHLLPTVVDTELYLPAPTRADGPLVVGWIGSPSTWRYVEPLLPSLLPQLNAAGAIFRAVGAGPGAARWTGVEALEWSEATEIAAVQSMDIGIMPLPDERWARGKCGYKLIQYMACGLPVIASPVGVNNQIVRDGVNGFLATDINAWATAITRLLTDSTLRARFGDAGRRIAIQEYSLATYGPKLASIILMSAASPKVYVQDHRI
jgi:glycosyltransferase involved in cell wall biosynthesis